MSRLTDAAWNSTREELLAMARRLRLASERLDAARENRNRSTVGRKAWEDASAEWHASRDAMFGKAFDNSPDPHLAAIRAGEPAAVETAIRFLETDPICFHAGYAKERFLRALKVVTLSADQARRLGLAMTHALDDGYRHELEDWCRLAPRLELADIRAALRQRAEHGDTDVRSRAIWCLERIDECLLMSKSVGG